MPFGKKAHSAGTSPEPEQQPVELSAQERLNALLAEQSTIHATLAEHRDKRAELLREDGTLGAIRALATEDDALKLRLEQLALRFADVERELAQERRDEFERAWLSHLPVLAQAEAELTEAIRAFFAAMERANAVYFRAQGFGERLREFVRPPPPVIFNEWALREFVKAVERRQQPAASSAPMLEMLVEAPLHIPRDKRFTPRRVPVSEIEAISPIAPPRRVRILHGPVRTSNLSIGHARLHSGETPIVPARAAHALVRSGCAEYLDETATVAA